MNRYRLSNLIIHPDETIAPTRDVLLAVSGALRGDRKRVRKLISKAQGKIRKRVQRELRSLGQRKHAASKKKLKIRGARLPPQKLVPPLAAAGSIEARLPDGRQVRLVLSPAAARHQDMLAVNQVSTLNTQRAFAAIRHNSRAINQLAAAQHALTKRLAKLQSNGDLALLKGLVEGLSNLEIRLEGVKRNQHKALAAQKRSVEKKLVRQAHMIKTQARTTRIQQLNNTVASLQTAAYGTQGSLLANNNILLAVNQLGWSFAPQILQSVGLTKPGATTSPLDWFAPLGSLVTSGAVLGRRQHERFVSGVVTGFTVSAPPVSVAFFAIAGGLAGVAAGRFGEKKISLRNQIAPAEWDIFRKRTDVPVTTVIIKPRAAFEAGILSTGEVIDGELIVRITAHGSKPVLSDMVVSWTVDTRRSDG